MYYQNLQCNKTKKKTYVLIINTKLFVSILHFPHKYIDIPIFVLTDVAQLKSMNESFSRKYYIN